MTNQSTIDKLIEMRLTTMADAFRNQLADPKFREVPFEDRFGMLVDIEYSNRKNNRLKRLIHNAGFDQPEASLTRISLTDLQLANIYLNTEIFLSPALQAVVKHTWPVPLAWRLVSSISIPSMSDSLICLWIWRQHGQMVTTKKSWQSMPIQLF